MAVSLELAKKHLRVFHNEEDEEIALYLAAAETWAMTYTSRDTVPVGAEFAFDAASLLMLAGMFENREAASVTAVHDVPTARRLLDPYRRMRV